MFSKNVQIQIPFKHTFRAVVLLFPFESNFRSTTSPDLVQTDNLWNCSPIFVQKQFMFNEDFKNLSNSDPLQTHNSCNRSTISVQNQIPCNDILENRSNSYPVQTQFRATVLL